MCHNFKNIVLVKESYDDKTELWHTKNSFIIPVNYIEPVLENTEQNDLFQLTKTPEKTSRQQQSPYAPNIMDVLLQFKRKSRTSGN